tara:strand:+ start:650 stop:1210 length:561 start_codon:yes stop_codon:yes gene_type:complete
MAHLSRLSENHALAVISLPYKAGLWVSHADDIEGEADDENEMKALERGIPALAEVHKDSAFIQAVASEIMRMKDNWSQWEEECFHIVKQAPDVMQVVQAEFGTAEARHYRRFVLELGKMVAQAHSELSAFDAMETDKKEGFLSAMIGKFVGGVATMAENDAGHPANISPSEKSALSQLSAALKVSE